MIQLENGKNKVNKWQKEGLLILEILIIACSGPIQKLKQKPWLSKVTLVTILLHGKRKIIINRETLLSSWSSVGNYFEKFEYAMLYFIVTTDYIIKGNLQSLRLLWEILP